MSDLRDPSAATPTPTTAARLRRRAVTVAAGVLVMQVGAGLPVPLYPVYQQRWALSAQHISLLFASLIVGIIAALLPAERLLARISPRSALVGAAALGGTAALLFAHAGAYPELVVAELLQGVAIGVFSGIGPAVMDRPGLPGGARTVGTLLTVANAVGLAAGPVVSGVVNDVAPAPHRLVFWLQAGVCGALLVAVRSAAGQGEADARDRRPSRGDRPPLSGGFALAVSSGFSGFAIGGLYSSLGSLAAHRILGVQSATLLGLVVTILFVANAVAGPVVMRYVRTRAAPVGLVCTATGLLLVAASLVLVSPVGFFLATVLTGAGQGVSIAAGTAAATAVARRAERPGAVSTFFLVCYVGTAFPAFTAGAVATATSLTFAWSAFCVAIASVCTIAAILSLRTRASEAP